MKLLFVFSKSPHRSVDAQEGLDALLMGSAFTECGLLFTGPGVLQLVAGQSPDDLGTKDFTRGFAALKDYGVQFIAARSTDLSSYGLDSDDLILPVEPVSDEALPGLLKQFDRVINF